MNENNSKRMGLILIAIGMLFVAGVNAYVIQQSPNPCAAGQACTITMVPGAGEPQPTLVNWSVGGTVYNNMSGSNLNVTLAQTSQASASFSTYNITGVIQVTAAANTSNSTAISALCGTQGGIFTSLCLMMGSTLNVFGQNPVVNSVAAGGVTYFAMYEKIKGELAADKDHSKKITGQRVSLGDIQIADSDLRAEWTDDGQQGLELTGGNSLVNYSRDGRIVNQSAQAKNANYYTTLSIENTKVTEFQTDYGTLDYGTSVTELEPKEGATTTGDEEFNIKINALGPAGLQEPTVPRTVDCLINKTLRGKTGAEALPKIKLDWTWAGISDTACDQGNANPIYCDATQFNIALMKKIKALDTSIRTLTNCDANQALEKCLERQTEANRQSVFAKLHFKSYLMRDGFTENFQKDFDNHFRYRTLGGASPDYTNADTGLWKFMSQTDKYRIVPKYAKDLVNYQLDKPGLYNVDIEVLFDKAGNALMDGSNNPQAKIKVVLDRVKVAEPDSPFYYLPFNGNIGIESGEVSRNGYGVDFRVSKGDPIVLSAVNQVDTVRTIGVSHAPTMKTIDISTDDSFKNINNERRGYVLELRGNKLIYSPSNANAAVLEVTKNSKGDAFAFYSLAVNGEAADTGAYLLRWTGMGLKCKDFAGRYVSEAFDETQDTHGTSRKCGRTDPFEEVLAYGVEWCGLPDSGKKGNAFMQTLIFTPQGKQTQLTKGAASDSSAFIQQGSKVNSLSFAGNSPFTNVQAVLDQVTAGNVCVASQGGAGNIFFWNPKKVFESQTANFEQQIQQDTFTDKCVK